MIQGSKIGMATMMVASLSSVAFAQDATTTTTEEAAPPAEATTEAAPAPEPAPMVEEMAPAAGGAGAHLGLLGAGKIGVDVFVGMNLSKELVMKPFSVSPDVHYGVNDDLTVSLVHSGYGASGFWAYNGAGNSLCLAGEENGCAKLYDNVGLNALYKLSDSGDMALAADGGLYLQSFDPMMMSLKLGVRGVWTSGQMAVKFNPAVVVGVTERDAGNKEVLSVPVSFNYMVNDQLHVGVQTGILGPLDGFGDFYMVPVALGAGYKINDNMTAGGAFSLDRVAGFEGPGAADMRSLGLFLMWRQ